MTAATNEYRRRYSTDPPPGFDQWFSFAQEQESIIIDNYDMIHNSLAPLRALSGQDIRKQMQYVYSHPDGDVWRCTFVAKTNKTECTHPSRSFDRHIHNLFDLLLGGGDFGTGQQNLTIPPLNVDVTFLVNHLDEPRVLLPPHGADTSINIADLSHQPVWDILTRTCTTKPTTSENTTSVNTYGLPFVTDIHGTNDLCQNPEYRDMHGMLESPVSFPLIQGLVPVLSCGVLSTMGDVPYPSAAYRESGFLYDETHDVPWEQKSKTVYWAGSTTGGYAVDGWNDAWRTFQRQRLVDVASGHQPHTLLSDRHGQVHTEKHHPNGRLWDIAFTRVFQCDHRACRAQISRFRPRPWAPADAALGAQLVVGVDGNGISGRYTKLLASSSAPLKQTLLREWHDERLVPWVHYFPLSQSLDEMPELATFLLTTETGQWAARTVAEEGRVWSQQALRPADMAVYMYRLLLELAQLQDPKRPAGAASAPVL
ncbi:hypothetical protein SBRCBS47491_006408 [Sporothrix bragantina]|uniref:Glycosyl transferase CAP10 domain-containing protein n=1 Tax=Sporothrix bragantina TaxID=671064 RepID=A0ABP0C4N6_9PEZI